ncbi:subtilisin SUB4 [Besnoitia besnoiti]|uniref:subtilisin n=1 Tax=Besnoitia besnoiti TaxID=94643 RepID=A0A2A9MGG0_BESBE|nr:subtilisin SUB4 [Besnoitia besnoiti]PFH34472.1 subtilisin SUB4 [Besnoitia besnoiti]
MSVSSWSHPRAVATFLLVVVWLILSKGSSASAATLEHNGHHAILLRQPYHTERAEHIRLPMSVQGELTEDKVETLEEISRQIAREVHMQQESRKRLGTGKKTGQMQSPSASAPQHSLQLGPQKKGVEVGATVQDKDASLDSGVNAGETKSLERRWKQGKDERIIGWGGEIKHDGGLGTHLGRHEGALVAEEVGAKNDGVNVNTQSEMGEISTSEGGGRQQENEMDAATAKYAAEELSPLGARLIIGLTEITFPEKKHSKVHAPLDERHGHRKRGRKDRKSSRPSSQASEEGTVLTGFASSSGSESTPIRAADSSEEEMERQSYDRHDGRNKDEDEGRLGFDAYDVLNHTEAVQEAEARLQSERLKELGIVKEMKVLENVGLVVLELNDDLSEDAIRETIKTLWQRNPSTWLIESDTEVNFRGRDEFASGDVIVVADVDDDSTSKFLEKTPNHEYRHEESGGQTEPDADIDGGNEGEESQEGGVHTSSGEAGIETKRKDIGLALEQAAEGVEAEDETRESTNTHLANSSLGFEDEGKVNKGKTALSPCTEAGAALQQPLTVSAGNSKKRLATSSVGAETRRNRADKHQSHAAAERPEKDKSPRIASAESTPPSAASASSSGHRSRQPGARVRVQRGRQGEDDAQPTFYQPAAHRAGLLKPSTGIVPLSLYEAVDSAVRESVENQFSSASHFFRSDAICTPVRSAAASEHSHNGVPPQQRSPTITATSISSPTSTESQTAKHGFSSQGAPVHPLPQGASGFIKNRASPTPRLSGAGRHHGKMPNDSLLSRQWAYHEPRVNVRAIEAWNTVYAHRLSREVHPRNESFNQSAARQRLLEGQEKESEEESTADDTQGDIRRGTDDNPEEGAADENKPNGKRKTIKKEPLIVAVIDTGVDYNHEDLRTQMWQNTKEIPNNGIDDDGNGYVDDVRGYDFEGKNNDPMDLNGHGTHVAGIIAAAANNRRGIAGVNWEVKVMPLKFISRSSAAAEAIDYSLRMGAKISTNSWGYTTPSEGLRLAVERTAQKGQLFVAAVDNAGKDNTVENDFPPNWGYDRRTGAGIKSLLRVANLSPGGIVASSSNWGPYNVDVAAPGTDIISTIPTGKFPEGYGYKTGTSMATPLVAGVAAMVWSAQPSMTAADVREIIMRTSTKMRSLEGRIASAGIVNAYAAVLDAFGEPLPASALEEDLTPPPSPAETVLSFLGGAPVGAVAPPAVELSAPSASSFPAALPPSSLVPLVGGGSSPSALPALETLVSSMTQLLTPFNRLFLSF